MTKAEYLNNLREALSGLPQGEIEDVLRDQQEYLSMAKAAGRSEEEVVASLGSPFDLARELKAQRKIQFAETETKLLVKTKQVFRAIVALCILAPLNLIFVLGPFVTALSILISMWAVGLSGGLVGLAGFAGAFYALMWSKALFFMLFFGSIGSIGLCLLFSLLCYYITAQFLKLSVKYLKWNFDFVSKGVNS